MTPEDKLREAAAAATPGPWKTKDLEVISVIPGTEDNNDIMVSGNPKDFIVISPYATISWQNATFIALANPRAVTELLDRIDELEGEKVELAEGFSKLQQEAVEALHQVERLKGEGKDLTQDVEAYHSDTLMLMSERDALRARVERLKEALGWFLSDDRFHVAVGGNPSVVENMIARARDTMEASDG